MTFFYNFTPTKTRKIMGLKNFFNKLTGKAKEVADKADDVFDNLVQEAEEALEVAKEKGGDYFEKAKIKAKEVADKAEELIDEGKEKAGPLAEKAKKKAEELMKKAEVEAKEFAKNAKEAAGDLSKKISKGKNEDEAPVTDKE